MQRRRSLHALLPARRLQLRRHRYRRNGQVLAVKSQLLFLTALSYHSFLSEKIYSTLAN